MTFRNHYMMIALLAGFGLALGACSSSGDAPAEETVVETPAPEPDPAPTDLETTQSAAADAAAAAKVASDAAAASASDAATATANLATLQTGEKARAYSDSAGDAADAAMAAYDAAKAAAAAAADATEASAAGRALENAETAQADAESAAMKAGEYAMKATEAAGVELHIDGTMKSVGNSSIDADMGMLTKTADDGSKTITGMLADNMQPMRTTDAVTGVPFVAKTTNNGTDTPYKQAVAAGSIKIGKLLDTTDDTARLMLITHHQGEKSVRVFVDGPTAEVSNVVGAATAATADTAETGGALAENAKVRPLGVYYQAEHYSDATTAAPSDTNLGAFDRVTVTDAKGITIYELSDVDGGSTTPARRVDSTTNAATGATTHTYRVVDILADGQMADGADVGADPDDLAVKTSIPAPTAYSHIHFGVWAGLGGAKNDGSQAVVDLGIGFVQNFSGSGVTDKQGIGTATFSGDWVAAVRGQGTKAIKLNDGDATLNANFDKGTLTADLDGLATLEGKLSGNGFSGTTAKDIEHGDLDSDGSFPGTFSGNIYGPKGEEAAGVFSFDGDEAGAFRGAFGGAQ